MNYFPKLKFLMALLWISVAFASNQNEAQAQSQSAGTNSTVKLASESERPASTIWQRDVGQGFLPTTQVFSV